MVELAVLMAIILLMAFTPIGYIRTFGLEISLIVIPVAVGAVTLGPAAGLLLGLVFGITSFIQCFGFSAFGTVLLGINPIFTFLVCVPTRALMGWLTGVIYQALKKGNITKKIALPAACLCGPVLNTILFMGTLCLCFYNTEYIQSFVSALGATNPLVFVALFVGTNGVIEAVAGFILGTAVSKALMVVMKQTGITVTA
jgi:uncharacterized membrane protein